jgi:hypothetical protein
MKDPYQKELWNKLSPSENGAFQEAASNLMVRVDEPVSFRSVKETDKRIRIFEEQQHAKAGSIASYFQRPIQALPPGYSKDRHFALIMLVIPWSMHSAIGTYFLSWDHEKWVVLVRQFGYQV